MSSDGSVSRWVDLLKDGDRAAAQPIWERYFERLVRLARRRLEDTPRGGADEEDVALSAFDSFCRRAELGRFPQLDDRNDLWRLLVLLTSRKAMSLRRHEMRKKRGGGRVRAGADLTRGGNTQEEVAQVVGDEPTPDFAAQVAEEWQLLLARLPEEGLKSVAQLKLEGHTDEEIAAKLSCAPRTIVRKLQRIRGLWEEENV